ncbi:MAG: tyrosine-type recombinase/integrase [Rubrivivax sp.]|nr:tyrosine-type recombinase/integrase [Rubrivivax sp.]
MPRHTKPLSAIEVQRLTKPGVHAVGTVRGLYIQVKTPETHDNRDCKTWLYRATIGVKRRWLGLGGYPSVTLAQAYQRARECADLIRDGIDPAQQMRDNRRKLAADQLTAKTFKQTAAEYIATKRKEWTNAKHAQQWENTLATYAYPKFGEVLVRDVEKGHILAALKPIWDEKHETASRLRGRIETVISYAFQAGYRPEGLNPARLQDNLDMLLGKPAKKGHFAALPIDDTPEFFQALRQRDGTGAQALQLAILCASRSGEVRGATWREFDLATGLWRIDAKRMKGKREHRVPLSQSAVALLQSLPQGKPDDFVFKGRTGGELSDATLLKQMRDMGVQAVPHGFRSTFSDWCAERTATPAEVREMALAHAIGDKTEAAYRRGDLFEKRRLLMQEWDRFLTTPKSTAGTVTPITAAKRA